MSSFENALVVGKFAPLHRGHQLLIDHATTVARRVTIVVWSNPDFSSMPNDVRAEWLRTLYPDATVLLGSDGPANAAPGAEQWQYVRRLLDDNGLDPDVVVSSEQYGGPFAAALGIEHVAVDVERQQVAISGSTVRSDVHAHRRWLDPCVYRHFVDRVVVLGAESTGKSTLTAALAEAHGTTWVHEYGRDHYEARGGVLDLDDYVEIARHHRALEDAAALDADRYLFVDTNALTTMFFSHYYNRGSLPELRTLADECRDRYRHVVVCDDDIPFVQDGWRDNVEWRGRMQGMVIHDLVVRHIGYIVVRGSVQARVQQVRKHLAAASRPSALT